MVFSPISRLIVLLSVQRLSSHVYPIVSRLSSNLASSHHVQQLCVFRFLWANTLALGSCLCDNRSKTRQRQAVVLSSIPPYKPPRKPRDLCVLRVSASLFRTFSHLARATAPYPTFALLKHATARKGAKAHFSDTFQKTLRVSVLFILRVSPKDRALATISSLRPTFALIAITCRSYRYQNYVVRGLISQYLLATSRVTTPI